MKTEYVKQIIEILADNGITDLDDITHELYDEEKHQYLIGG